MKNKLLLDTIAFCETLCPPGGHKPDSKWMPWDVYVKEAKEWNEKHPNDKCYLPKEDR